MADGSASAPSPSPHDDLWQPSAPISPRPGNPPTALVIALLCSACTLYAVVAYALHRRQAAAIRKAEAVAHARKREATVSQMHQRGGPTKCSPTRSGSPYHLGKPFRGADPRKFPTRA
jgi:hypothetical protein